MTDWQEIYKSKLVSLEDAVKIISPGERVFYSLGGSAPVDLVNVLSKRLPELGGLTFIHALAVYPFDYLYKPEYKDYFKHESLFYFFGDRNGRNTVNVELYSYQFSNTESLFANKIKPDVLMFECAPPDENGYLSYGMYGTFNNDQVSKQASKIIVQVNRNAPYVLGEKNLIHVSAVDCITEKDHELFEMPSIPITEIETKIAASIVERIADGSTIQVGIGGLADAICSFLDSKKDLGVHTEMFVDSMMPLTQKGIINGSKKTLHPGEITCSFGGTSRKVFAYMHNNPAIRMYPISYINDPYIIAQNDNMVCVNNAITVDLTGQVCSESIGFKQYSGTGGQVDFVRGAAMSKNGQSFISLSSSVKGKDGQLINRIVLELPPGQVVTTPRTDVDMVVTEYGIAELRYKSLPERAKAMIAIAHPQFRDELKIEAKKVGLL